MKHKKKSFDDPLGSKVECQTQIFKKKYFLSVKTNIPRTDFNR